MQLKVAVSEQDQIQGTADAKITLVEYGDYQCPHCGHAHGVVKQLQKHFGKSMRFVFRNFPLVQIHPMAEPAAEAAEFAAAHGKFWEMHDGIFEHQDELSADFLLSLAKKIGLDTKALSEALEQGTYRDVVRKGFMGGVRSGVNGTPTFFIDGQRYDGAPDFGSLSAAMQV